MKKRRVINIIACVIILLSACKKENVTHNAIVGNWELKSHSVYSNEILTYNYDYTTGKSFTFRFNDNNTYTLSSVDSVLQSGDYKLSNDTLYQHYKNDGIEEFGYQLYSILNGKLTISDSEGFRR
ncbi:MAG: hypothetical protein ABI374_12845 [Ginsengibacter sp.]